VFQPHRYSRTRDLMDEFSPALALADLVVLTDIYAAGEATIPGVTVDALAQAIGRRVPALHVVRDLADVPAAIARLAHPGDLLITLGAGSISGVGDQILHALAGATPAGAVAGGPR